MLPTTSIYIYIERGALTRYNKKLLGANLIGK